MNEQNQKVEAERQMLADAEAKGPGAKFKTYVKLSGPGWLQSAITLGGGSLAGSLFLGVLGGFKFLWLQMIAMILGVVMLSAIAYVTLSTGERPFRAINRHISPVLGWGWALATLAANVVWCLPQFSLGTAAIQQNLLGLSGDSGKVPIAIGLLIVGVSVIWFYESGKKGVKVFESVLKGMVGVVVLSFFGVVITMAVSGNGLPWGEIFAGFIPDLSLLNNPDDTFTDALAAVGDKADYWRNYIVSQQQDVMVAAAATAVGINMTFLLPYSMLKKGWGSQFRGLAIFDLSTGLFIPFILATSCVVIASATQFHGQYEKALTETVLDAEGKAIVAPAGLVKNFNNVIDGRIKKFDFDGDGAKFKAFKDDKANAAELQAKRDAVPKSEKVIAAMLTQRAASDLSKALSPLTGKTVADTVFGIGVMGMAISTIIILMLINGFVICEIFGKPQGGLYHRIGCMIPAAVGVFGPFIWGKAAFYLAVPTSVFGFILLPIAYSTFFLMMNNKKLLGAAMPQGGKRFAWNILMAVAVILAGIGSVYMAHKKAGMIGIGCIIGFVVLVVGSAFMLRGGTSSEE